MTLVLHVQKRDELGSEASRLLRREGKLPAVLYGGGKAAMALVLEAREFERVYREAGESTVISVTGIDGDKQVLIHEVDFDPVLDVPRHVDLYAVKKGQKVTVEVPLVFSGVAPAEKELGAMIIKVIHDLEVEAEPQHLPHELEVNLEVLKKLEDQITVGDIALPAGVTTTLEPEEVVVTVAAAKEEEPETVEGEAPDLSQVEISEERGKKDDEEKTSE